MAQNPDGFYQIGNVGGQEVVVKDLGWGTVFGYSTSDVNLQQPRLLGSGGPSSWRPSRSGMRHARNLCTYAWGEAFSGTSPT
jgi:hypothetical protein